MARTINDMFKEHWEKVCTEAYGNNWREHVLNSGSNGFSRAIQSRSRTNREARTIEVNINNILGERLMETGPTQMDPSIMQELAQAIDFAVAPERTTGRYSSSSEPLITAESLRAAGRSLRDTPMVWADVPTPDEVHNQYTETLDSTPRRFRELQPYTRRLMTDLALKTLKQKWPDGTWTVQVVQHLADMTYRSGTDGEHGVAGEIADGRYPKICMTHIESELATFLPKQANHEADNYILFMAGQLKLDMSKVNLIKPRLYEAFKAKNRMGINEILIGEAATLTVEAADIKIEDEQFKALAEVEAKWAQDTVNRRLNELKNNVQSYSNDIRGYYSSIDRNMTSIAQWNRELERLENRKPDESKYKNEIETLAQKGFKLHNIDLGNGVVSFITPEITLSHFNGEAGINYAVPMGQYEIKVYLNNFGVRVHTFAKNLIARRHAHPHLDTGNNMCYGNAANAYRQGSVERSIEKVVLTTYAVLSEYNDESPFVSLQQFWQLNNPDYLKSLEQVWVKMRNSVWAIDDDLPCTPRDQEVIEHGEDEDGNQTTLLYLYTKQYKGTGIDVNDGDGNCIYAVLAGNNRYVEVDAALYNAWEDG